MARGRIKTRMSPPAIPAPRSARSILCPEVMPRTSSVNSCRFSPNPCTCYHSQPASQAPSRHNSRERHPSPSTTSDALKAVRFGRISTLFPMRAGAGRLEDSMEQTLSDILGDKAGRSVRIGTYCPCLQSSSTSAFASSMIARSNRGRSSGRSSHSLAA